MDSSDAAILTGYFRLAKRSKTLSPHDLSQLAIKARSDLAKEVLRATVEALPNELENATIGGLVGLDLLNLTLAMDELAAFAVSLSSKEGFSELVRSMVRLYPGLRSGLVETIQDSYAVEVKSQTVGPRGGLLLGTEGDVEVVVPRNALASPREVELHSYECSRVSAFEEEDGVLCHGISPHSFNQKVTVHFDVPDDNQQRRCFKASDEIGDDWEEVECYFTEGRAIYISSEFSIITARLTNEPRFTPDPNVGTTISEIPQQLHPSSADNLPRTRFNRLHERKPSGMHGEYLIPIQQDTVIYGTLSGINVGMHGLTMNSEQGIMYWSNGFKLQYVLVEAAIAQTPFIGAPQTLLEGTVRVDIEGVNLGANPGDLIGVRIADNVKCIPRAYISSSRIVCDIVEDYSKVAHDPLRLIDSSTVLVSTHRRDISYNRGIPQVDHVRVHPAGRKPVAVHFEATTRTLCWSEKEFEQVLCAPLAEDGKRFNGPTQIVLENVDVRALGFDPSKFELYYLEHGRGVFGRVHLKHSFSQAAPAEELIAGEPHLTDFALDFERGQAVLTKRYGEIIKVQLVSPFKKTSILQRASKSRLASIALSGNDTNVAYVADQESSQILNINLHDPYRPAVAARSTLWPMRLITLDDRIYWTEYLGQVWAGSLAEEPVYKLLLHDQQGIQSELAKNLRKIKTGYLELVSPS